ncbi:agaB34, partial [Symbiodinium pilosum]
MPDASFCISSDGNRVGNGVKVHLWKCDQLWQSGGQNFFMDEAGRLRLHQTPDYCVVIDGDRYENGAKIQLWKCNEGNRHQTWYFNEAGQIEARHAPGKMCLVIDANQAFNGAKVQLWSCQWSADKVQDWLKISLSPSGYLAYALPNEDKACTFPFEPVTTNT